MAIGAEEWDDVDEGYGAVDGCEAGSMERHCEKQVGGDASRGNEEFLMMGVRGGAADEGAFGTEAEFFDLYFADESHEEMAALVENNGEDTEWKENGEEDKGDQAPFRYCQSQDSSLLALHLGRMRCLAGGVCCVVDSAKGC